MMNIFLYSQFANNLMKPSLKRISQSISNFIQKTYEILEHEQNDQIISWTLKGTSFLIKDAKLFESQILPKYFKHSNFSSFVRQLNMYNFHKIRGDKHENQFEHEKFKKGQRQLLYKIKRKQNQLLNAQMPESHIIHFQSVESIQPDLQNNTQKYQQHGKTESDNYQVKSNLETLKLQNNLLKNNKQKLTNQLKNMNTSNNVFIGEKFYKLIASLITQKIKIQLHHDIEQNIEYGEKIPITFDQLIQHIVGNQQPFEFAAYKMSAMTLLKKHTDQFFMLQKGKKKDNV